MISSKGMEKKNKEILVYQRRRKTGTTSGQKASSNKKISLPLGCSIASTNADKVDREIKEDGVSKMDQEKGEGGVSKIEEDQEEDEQIKVHREIGEDGSYYECDNCLEEGDLLCCDTCPRAFHLKCLSLKSVPDGEWQCAKCWYASLSDSKNK